ncbi:hypothetical protein GCM10009545_35370 [Saccharopolyspora thermophila]|uniref:Uncharacterized protein n=2 Tax=Saccharopolyspora thermophila TaxID=89367 RepID=A0ABN1CZ03_9PSEU
MVVLSQRRHAPAWTVGMVLGPVIGAAVAVVITWGYAAIYAENQRRHQPGPPGGGVPAARDAPITHRGRTPRAG